ncbi:MAG TPA: hypothetical protein VK776_17800 [Bryobacteraceae bacterium]|jgi:hypothetical protein|nr:hypothetical protein [Bryobacteraceae bacterium]
MPKTESEPGIQTQSKHLRGLFGGNVGPSQLACENADCVLEAVHVFNDLNLDYEPAIQLSGINSNGFVHMVSDL